MARRVYPQYPAVPIQPGHQLHSGFASSGSGPNPQHYQSAPQHAVYPSQQPSIAPVPGPNNPVIPQPYPAQHYGVSEPPVAGVTAGVQHMQLGQSGGHHLGGPPSAQAPPHSASAQPLHTHFGPVGGSSDPSLRRSSMPYVVAAPPTSTTSGPELMPEQPPRRAASTGQLPGQQLSAPTGQALYTSPSSHPPTGHLPASLPPPHALSGQITVGGQPMAPQLHPPALPQPTASIQPQQTPAWRPPLGPPSSGTTAPSMHPSPATAAPPLGHPMARGLQHLPPPPKAGEAYNPPSSAHQPGLPPPPKPGEAYVPVGPVASLPPLPMAGQSHPPSTAQPPATQGGQNLTPSPPTGQPSFPPPPPGGQPAAGQSLPMGPAGQNFSTRAPSLLGPKALGPGAAAAQSPATGIINAQSDPELQPVNLLETRNILPSTPLTPPPIILPGRMGSFNPPQPVFCCTMNAVPATNNLLNKLKLPLAISIHPYKEMTKQECPVIQPSVIVRCRVCRSYINPFVTFIDTRHWRCNLCFRPNSLPEDFDYNPHTGSRGDRSHRLDIRRSSVEYIAPSEYMIRPPQPCVYYFLVDVSFSAVDSGLLGVFCKTLLSCLDQLPGDARMLVGILTYDSTLHFYNLNPSLSQPQMLVVSDVDDVFLPSPNSLLASLKESKELVRTLLEDLPGMFAGNQNLKSALGPALQAAEKLLHSVGGRITVFQSCLPNTGPGALKYRDVTPSSVKMDTLNMAAASDFYKKLALDCSSQQIAVDLFALSGQFIDLTTISCVSKFSSGQVYYYPDFHIRKDVPRQKVEEDFRRYLTRKIGFEAVMRVRCTEGLSMHTFHGNFFVRSTDLLSLPNVNPDHGYTMNIAIDESLKDIGAVCFQAALLYTSSRGERRIRVHTLCLPVATQLANIYAKLDVQAISGVLANMAIDRSVSATLGDAREALINTAVDSTKMYRSTFASSMQASQFNLPASLRLLPLFMLSLLKHPAFTLNSKVSYDVRAQAMNLIKSMPLPYVLDSVYPKLYALHCLSDKDFEPLEDSKKEQIPPILQLSAEKLSRQGVFLMDYGLGMYIWVSKDAPPEAIKMIFGVQHFGAIPEIMVSLPSLDNDLSLHVGRLIKKIRSSKQHFMPLLVVREDGPHRLLFIDRLVEDRTEDGTAYYEFLTHLSRQLNK